MKELKRLVEMLEELEEMCDEVEDDEEELHNDAVIGVHAAIHNCAQELALNRRLAVDGKLITEEEFDDRFVEEYKDSIRKAKELSRENAILNGFMMRLAKK